MRNGKDAVVASLNFMTSVCERPGLPLVAPSSARFEPKLSELVKANSVNATEADFGASGLSTTTSTNAPAISAAQICNQRVSLAAHFGTSGPRMCAVKMVRSERFEELPACDYEQGIGETGAVSR